MAIDGWMTRRVSSAGKSLNALGHEMAEMGIPFTDLSGLFRTSSADDRVIWRRCDSDRLLGEPVEEQPAGL